MNQKQRAKWERIRAKGMWRFVLVYGVLWWGGFMIIATSIYGLFFRRLSYSLDDFSITVPALLVGGFVFGLACWFVGEYKYQRSSSNASLS